MWASWHFNTSCSFIHVPSLDTFDTWPNIQSTSYFAIAFPTLPPAVFQWQEPWFCHRHSNACSFERTIHSKATDLRSMKRCQPCFKQTRQHCKERYQRWKKQHQRISWELWEKLRMALFSWPLSHVNASTTCQCPCLQRFSDEKKDFGAFMSYRP